MGPAAPFAVAAAPPAEYQRLRAQARLWEQVTARALDRVGTGAGMRCLDVGCGPGEVMRLMAERVGAGGRVTGLDNDGRAGREAVEVLRATVAGLFEFIQAGAETTGEPAGGPFDLVYPRLLLFHLRDPVAMLRRMYAWTRPGGVLLVQDWDCRTMDIVPRPARHSSPRSPKRSASAAASECHRCW